MAATAAAPHAGLRRGLLAARRDPRRVLRCVLALVGTCAAAVWIGYHLPFGEPVSAVVTVAGVTAVLVLGALALHRFEWFVWVVLLTRPLLDLTKGERGAVGSSSGLPAALLGAAVIVLGAVWIAGLSREGRRLPLGAMSRALVLLTVVSLISVLHSAAPVTSVLQVARTTGAVVLFLILEQLLRTRRQAKRMLVVCAASTIGPLGIGLYQLAAGGGSTGQVVSRVTGSFLHPNTFGLFLVMLLLLGYALRRHLTRPTRRLVDVVLVLAAVNLVFTYSRGSWVVLVIGLLVLAVLAERRLFLLMPLGAAAIFHFAPNIMHRLSDLGNEDTVGGRPGNSGSWRIAHLRELLSAAGDWSVFGIGPKMTERLTTDGRPPHNDAIRMFLETGVVGLVAYLVFLTSLVLLAWRALRTLRVGLHRGLAVGFAAIVVAFLVDSMGANLITQFVLLIYVLAIAAIVQAWIATAEPPEVAPTNNHRASTELAMVDTGASPIRSTYTKGSVQVAERQEPLITTESTGTPRWTS